MKNLWPESFEENPRQSPKVIFEEQAKLLPKITGDIVFAEVVDEHSILLPGIEGEFRYRFNIVGKFIGDYRFRVLSFAHDIALYPVNFNLDGELGKELGMDIKSQYKKNIGSPEELEEFLGQILKSKRIQQVIGSIIKLSK
jgi:hypothetical protein